MEPRHNSETEAELTERAAALIIQAAWQAASERGRCTIALSGGSSPRPLYRMISKGLSPAIFTHNALPLPAEAREKEGPVSLPWQHCLFFWGDERCVPPDDMQSNYRMASEELFYEKNPEELNVFRMHGKPLLQKQEPQPMKLISGKCSPTQTKPPAATIQLST